MEKHNLVCIVCPVGCRMTLTEDKNADQGYEVDGNKCKRGIIYGIEELSNPTRVITSTIKIEEALFRRLPVKTDGLVPKESIFECMKLINAVHVTSPVKVGQVLIENILNTGVNVVSSRSM